jgi:hypothetical protein
MFLRVSPRRTPNAMNAAHASSTRPGAAGLRLLAGLLSILAGCAQVRGPAVTTPPGPEAATDEPVAAPVEDPMTVYRSDKPLPVAKGALERIDCLAGKENLHARMALEARGGQVTSFAYYSRWNFYTCSISLDRRDKNVRWRLTADGATRVQTPHGSFLIRTEADSYRFEFRNVERMKFCGMYGRMSGEMAIRRKVRPPRCEARGILDL